MTLENHPADGIGAATGVVPVVGIGASAGGLEPMGELLEAIPINTGFAFLIVSHLDPTHESLLVPILRKYRLILGITTVELLLFT